MTNQYSVSIAATNPTTGDFAVEPNVKVETLADAFSIIMPLMAGQDFTISTMRTFFGLITTMIVTWNADESMESIFGITLMEKRN